MWHDTRFTDLSECMVGQVCIFNNDTLINFGAEMKTKMRQIYNPCLINFRTHENKEVKCILLWYTFMVVFFFLLFIFYRTGCQEETIESENNKHSFILIKINLGSSFEQTMMDVSP